MKDNKLGGGSLVVMCLPSKYKVLVLILRIKKILIRKEEMI